MTNEVGTSEQSVSTFLLSIHSKPLSSMAKKTRVSTGEAPNPNSVPNRDILQRLNFLYQASNFFNTLAVENTPSSSKETCKPSTTDSSSTLENGSSDPSSSKRNGGSQPCRKKKRRRRQQITTQTLSRTLVASMKVTGQKTNVRMCGIS